MELFCKENLNEYEEFVKQHKKGHFMQSYLWGRVKTDWKWDCIIKRDSKGKIIATMAFLIRKVPSTPFSLMYCPRGPVCNLNDKELFKELIEDAKEIARKYGAYLIKLDPDIKADNREFYETVKELNFIIRDDAKGFENIQPRFVFRLDVAGHSEQSIMDVFHSKTRYNIRVAIKNNVIVKIEEKDKLSDFVDIMKVTGERDKFITRPLSYFEKMADALGENMRLYMAYHEGKPIAGTICVNYGNKVWYLYGASSNEHRNLMPNYLLQYEMIKWAIESKADIYDFRGISGLLDESNPLYGLYRFKRGFNGEFTEFIGELDLIVKPLAFRIINKALKLRKRILKFRR